MPSAGIAVGCRELLPRVFTLTPCGAVCFLRHLLSAGRLPSCRLPVRKYGGSCCPDFPLAAALRGLPAIESVAVYFKGLMLFKAAKIRKKTDIMTFFAPMRVIYYPCACLICYLSVIYVFVVFCDNGLPKRSNCRIKPPRHLVLPMLRPPS